MAFGGLNRSYRVYQPAGLAAAAPLVVMLHGVTGNGEQAENSYGWDPLADSAKFVVAYPDGVERAWNGHGCCGRPARENIDDVGFITAMVGQISAAVAIDKSLLINVDVEVESRDAAADSVRLRRNHHELTIGTGAASKLLVEIER